MTRWAPIEGFPGYEVSDGGQVRSKYRVLKPSSAWTGHQKVALRCNRKTVVRAIHRLVLEAFTGPPPFGTVAIHLNETPYDNRLENLKWGTQAENIKRRHLGQKRTVATQREIGEAIGVHQGTISAKLNGSRPMTVPFAKKVADFLGRDWKEIFDMPRSDIAKALKKKASELEVVENQA